MEIERLRTEGLGTSWNDTIFVSHFLDVSSIFFIFLSLRPNRHGWSFQELYSAQDLHFAVELRQPNLLQAPFLARRAAFFHKGSPIPINMQWWTHLDWDCSIFEFYKISRVHLRHLPKHSMTCQVILGTLRHLLDQEHAQQCQGTLKPCEATTVTTVAWWHEASGHQLMVFFGEQLLLWHDKKWLDEKQPCLSMFILFWGLGWPTNRKAKC